MLRRTKEQVAADLPPRIEHVVEVELAPRHRAVYDRHLHRERQRVLGLLDDIDGNRFEITPALREGNRSAGRPSRMRIGVLESPPPVPRYVSQTEWKERRMATRVEFEDDDGQVVRYLRHVNGGGLVSPGARVHEGASVASTAYVEAGARVGDRSRIGEGSWLENDVLVGEGVVIDRNVHLGPRTRVHDGVRIGAGARIGSDVVIGRGARLPADAIVSDGTVVRRSARSARSDLGIAA